MAEYIEKEAVIKLILETPFTMSMCLSEQECHGMNRAKQIYARLIEQDVPSADVRENVRGEWIDKEVFTAKGNVDMLQSALCPKCGRYHTTPYSYYFTNYEFCPRCGAKMEGQDG